MIEKYEEIFGGITQETTAADLLDRITNFKDEIVQNDSEYSKLNTNLEKLKKENADLTEYNRKLYNKIVVTSPDKPEEPSDTDSIDFNTLAKLYTSKETMKRRL